MAEYKANLNAKVSVEMLQYFKGKQDALNESTYVKQQAGMGLTHNDLTDELKSQYNQAQANVLEAVQVNGTSLTIAGKTVNITIAPGATNGTLAVNGVDVAFTGAADLFSKMATLISTDANKSVRQIAAEELAKELIPENAKEAMDTIQELAAWLQSHPEDAAAMNAAITKLNGILAGIGGDGDESATVAAYVAAEIAAAIADINTKLDGIEEGAQVNKLEKVSLKDGDTTTELTITEKGVTIDVTNKVSKKDGMDLSHNDFTDELKAKLEGIVDATTADIDALFESGTSA